MSRYVGKLPFDRCRKINALAAFIEVANFLASLAEYEDMKMQLRLHISSSALSLREFFDVNSLASSK